MANDRNAGRKPIYNVPSERVLIPSCIKKEVEKLAKKYKINKAIAEMINTAKLDYVSDIEWVFKFENAEYCIEFYKDENGKNHIEQFLKNVKGVWVELTPTDEEIKTMWLRLDNTPFREVDTETEERIADLHDYYGVERKNFY